MYRHQVLLENALKHCLGFSAWRMTNFESSSGVQSYKKFRFYFHGQGKINVDLNYFYRKKDFYTRNKRTQHKYDVQYDRRDEREASRSMLHG